MTKDMHVMSELLDLGNEQIILEIRELVNSINKISDNNDIYCELMKQLFLSSSNKN